MQPEDIIIQPLLTEKSSITKELHKYTFKVHSKANKIQVKYALKELYNVKPLACHIITVKGKVKRQGRFVGRTSAWKKAIVTLQKGDTISVYEGL